MKVWIQLAWRSLKNRALTSGLTVLSIAVSVALLLGVEKIRVGAKESFQGSVSGVDLIVGARTGPIQLLLYSVFHMGDATNNIGISSYERFARHSSTDWTIPISLGDSHRGFRVVATDGNFYEHYRFRKDHAIELANGARPDGIFDVALGSEVAHELGYTLGQKLVLSHGISEGGGLDHGDKPFTVVSILKRTGTPIDRALFITLEGMEAVHVDWKTGAPPLPGQEVAAATLKKEDLKPKLLTAFFLRTKSRVQAIYLQREINDYDHEALLGILPGVALSQLWRGLSYAETALQAISILVVLSGLLGMIVALYTSLNERRREMAIYRALGASPSRILFLLLTESFVLSLSGAILGLGMIYGLLAAIAPWIESEFGLELSIRFPTPIEWAYLGVVAVMGLILGMIPAWRAFKNTLSDGLIVRT